MKRAISQTETFDRYSEQRKDVTRKIRVGNILKIPVTAELRLCRGLFSASQIYRANLLNSCPRSSALLSVFWKYRIKSET